jgi:hypothetical protein
MTSVTTAKPVTTGNPATTKKSNAEEISNKFIKQLDDLFKSM